jgi:hypothetical protein
VPTAHVSGSRLDLHCGVIESHIMPACRALRLPLSPLSRIGGKGPGEERRRPSKTTIFIQGTEAHCISPRRTLTTQPRRQPAFAFAARPTANSRQLAVNLAVRKPWPASISRNNASKVTLPVATAYSRERPSALARRLELTLPSVTPNRVAMQPRS